MQPHHQAIALAVTWLATLVALPLLLSAARRGAHSLGVIEGQQVQQALHMAQVQDLERVMANKQAELGLLQSRFDASTEAHRKTVADLEARIMSYTGVAVTKADYELLIGTVETLRLTERTLNALKAQEQATAAAARAKGIDGLAKRVHTQLRDKLASVGVAA